jgi:dihydrofolate synthase / folylpolyglutamate synthase
LFELCKTNNIPATFFEITTALAFVQFQRQKCDAIVLEVGIGGRLDSTNIVTPALSVLTTVQLDHIGVLGDTIDKIAIEKAGIIKRNVDALIGPGCPLSVMQVSAHCIGVKSIRCCFV